MSNKYDEKEVSIFAKLSILTAWVVAAILGIVSRAYSSSMERMAVNSLARQVILVSVIVFLCNAWITFRYAREGWRIAGILAGVINGIIIAQSIVFLALGSMQF